MKSVFSLCYAPLYIPNARNAIDDEAKIKMEKLLDMLDDNDDVQNVWHNWEEPTE